MRLPMSPAGAAAALLLMTALLAACTTTDQGADPRPRGSSAPPGMAPTLQEVDGGPDYYARFSDSLPVDPSFFVLGVWLESIHDLPDLDKDRTVGINTYVNVTDNSNLAQIQGRDAWVITPWPYEGSSGYYVSDEVDMWAGPGDGDWTGRFPGEGSICAPPGSKCGYTVQQHLSDAAPEGQLRYANFGKGVTFWQNDVEASRFVNGYQDVVSADNYWFTDPNICAQSEGGTMFPQPRALTAGECRRAANYGWTVDRMRSLVQPSGSVPVWAFVEVGQPFQEASSSITSGQIRAAVWSSIIHGARGIVYFNHSFGGSCQSHHVLRDCGPELRSSVGQLNAQIEELAPALNAPTVVNGASTEDGSVDVLVKLQGEDLVVVAASTAQRPQQATIRIHCAGDGEVEDEAQVLWEDRRVHVVDSTITDRFADAEAVHVYRLDGSACGRSPSRQ